MARTSSKQLDQMAAHISKVTGIPVAVSWAYGRPRLESADGSRDISPRLQSGQLMDWMRAFLDGWQAARGHGAGAKENPRWRAAKRTTRRRRNSTAGKLPSYTVHPFADQSAWGIYKIVPGGVHGTRLQFVSKWETKEKAQRIAALLVRADKAEAVFKRPRKRGKRNPLLGIFGANPRARVVRELGRVVEVRYKRKDDGGLYFHKYSSKPRLLALSDGSIWIKGA